MDVWEAGPQGNLRAFRFPLYARTPLMYAGKGEEMQTDRGEELLQGLKERITTAPAPRWHSYRTPLGADHLIAPSNICFTCNRRDHPEEYSAADNAAWIAGTLFLKDREYAQELAAAGAQVSLELRP